MKKMIHFYPIAYSLNRIEMEIANGNSLYKSMQNHTIYDQRMISIIEVGEETNQLNISFQRLNEQYTNEVSLLTTLMGDFLEPLLIIVVGIFVALILIAMYLPMFSLSSVINN